MDAVRTDWSEKPDIWLTDALQSEQPDEVESALSAFQAKYRMQLERYVRRSLPFDWVEDVLQEIWVGFYRRARVERIENSAALLKRIAQHKRADAVRRLYAERAIESDQPAPEDADDDRFGVVASVEEILAHAEQRWVEEQQLDHLAQAPFLESMFSDCERVLWILRAFYDYPSRVISRLLGKQVNNVDSQYRYARKRLLHYFQSEEFALALAQPTLPGILAYALEKQASFVVDRFAQQVTPQFALDELKPLGLTPETFQEQYVISLMMPWWYEAQQTFKTNLPSLLLTRRTDWQRLQHGLKQLAKNPARTDLAFPEECLINVDVEEDAIRLSVQVLIEMVPSDENNTYVSMHRPRTILPVVLASWDPSLYTSEVHKRWPFLTNEP